MFIGRLVCVAARACDFLAVGVTELVVGMWNDVGGLGDRSTVDISNVMLSWLCSSNGFVLCAEPHARFSSSLYIESNSFRAYFFRLNITFDGV
jgi:hypothetical protein